MNLNLYIVIYVILQLYIIIIHNEYIERVILVYISNSLVDDTNYNIFISI